jgi:hypothetical protein
MAVSGLEKLRTAIMGVVTLGKAEYTSTHATPVCKTPIISNSPKSAKLGVRSCWAQMRKPLTYRNQRLSEHSEQDSVRAQKPLLRLFSEVLFHFVLFISVCLCFLRYALKKWICNANQSAHEAGYSEGLQMRAF